MGIDPVIETVIAAMFREVDQAKAEKDLSRLDEIERSYRDQIESRRDFLMEKLSALEGEEDAKSLRSGKESLTLEERVRRFPKMMEWYSKRFGLQSSIEICEFHLRNTIGNYVEASRTYLEVG